MKNIPLLIVTLVGTLALIVGIAVMFSQDSQPQVVDEAVLVRNARLVMGATESAQVTIVEFSDLQCPACKAVEPLVKQVQDKYPDKVRVVYRHYPLTNIHQYAQLAAQASEVAAEQNKFWQMHDRLFATQETWAVMKSESEVKEEFAKYAVELGIDKSVFLERIESDEIKQRVASDVADGTTIKINATPTFFVNGRKLTAPQQLPSAVESLL